MKVCFDFTSDYLVSPRLSITRLMLSDFCNGSNRAKILGLCQKVNDLYERPCLLLEKDKPSDDGIIPRYCNKYLKCIASLVLNHYLDVFTQMVNQEPNMWICCSPI